MQIWCPTAVTPFNPGVIQSISAESAVKLDQPATIPPCFCFIYYVKSYSKYNTKKFFKNTIPYCCLSWQIVLHCIVVTQAKLQRQETETKAAQETSLELWVHFVVAFRFFGYNSAEMKTKFHLRNLGSFPTETFIWIIDGVRGFGVNHHTYADDTQLYVEMTDGGSLDRH